MQGDLRVQYSSNIPRVWEQKKKETNEYPNTGEVKAHMREVEAAEVEEQD